MTEDDLSQRYNEGLVPAPQMTLEPPRIPRPAWQPEAARVQAAWARLWRSSLLIGLILCALLLLAALALGWRP